MALGAGRFYTLPSEGEQLKIIESFYLLFLWNVLMNLHSYINNMRERDEIGGIGSVRVLQGTACDF